MTATEASLKFPFSRGNDPINPPPEYARLRAEPQLVRARLWNGSSTWLLTRWADVREVLGSPDFSVDSEKAEKIVPVLDRWAELIRRVNG